MAGYLRSRNVLILGALALIGILLTPFLLNYLFLLETWWIYRGVDFPDETQIQAMTASLGMPTKDSNNKSTDDYIAEFPVPPEHFPKILGALLPAEKDYEPLPWFGMGFITLTCRDGREIKVSLYRVDDDPNSFPGDVHRFYQDGKGAFSIGGRRGAVYFRGGTSKDLEAAIRQAHADYELTQLKK